MTLQASGNAISFSQIETEFGQNTNRKLGTYKVSQTVGGLTNQPLDTGIPQGEGTPIKFSDFYSKKLNVVIDYWSGEEENYTIAAREKYDLDSEQGTYTVIGGFRTRPESSSGTKTRIHVNKRIGGMEILPETDTPLYCSLRTGTGWEAGTDLSVEIGSSGQLWGAGGRGGDGGRNSTVKNGESGKGGNSALGIQYDGTTVINDGIISQGHGGGGGGGYNEVSGNNVAPGGAGGGGAGYPVGNGGLSYGPTTTVTESWTDTSWNTVINFTYQGTWSAAQINQTAVQSSDARFVVKDYNTGTYSTKFDGYDSNNKVEFRAYPINNDDDSDTGGSQYYKWIYNGVEYASLAGQSGQLNWGAWKFTTQDRYINEVDHKEWGIKAEFRDVNNQHKFYIDGTLVGSNTNGSRITSGDERYTMGSLVSDQSLIKYNPYKSYKIKKEVLESSSHSSSTTLYGNSGSGESGAFVNGGDGEEGTSAQHARAGGGGGGGGAGEYGAVDGGGGEGGAGGNNNPGGDGTATAGGTGGTGNATTGSVGEGTGGAGGAAGAAIRRTSGITVNITNNATINGPTNAEGISV